MPIPMDEVGNTIDKLALIAIELLRGNPEAYENVAKELDCTVIDLEVLYQFVTTMREEADMLDEFNNTEFEYDPSLNEPLSLAPPTNQTKH